MFIRIFALALLATLLAGRAEAYCDGNLPEVRQLNRLVDQSNAIKNRFKNMQLCAPQKLKLIEQRLGVLEKILSLANNLGGECAADDGTKEIIDEYKWLADQHRGNIEACGRCKAEKSC